MTEYTLDQACYLWEKVNDLAHSLLNDPTLTGEDWLREYKPVHECLKLLANLCWQLEGNV